MKGLGGTEKGMEGWSPTSELEEHKYQGGGTIMGGTL